MEERRDLQGNGVRQSSLRGNGSLKSTLSGRSTPRGSPSFRRLNSSRTPRRDGRGATSFQWIRSNRLLLWLILITLWAYLGFYVQSKWAHGDNSSKQGFVGYRSKESVGVPPEPEHNHQRDVLKEDFLVVTNASKDGSKKGVNLSNMNVSLVKKASRGSSRRSMSVKKTKRSTTERRLRGRTRGKEKVVMKGSNDRLEEVEEEIPKRNTSYGLLLGPFGATEDRILGWNAEKRSGTCDRKGEFARLVWSRKFVLIFHELSMTGAPLSMLELATELLSCGATVSAVVLSKRGGLMAEITRRKIKVLEDKTDNSFKTAMKVDLVIAGSAVCASWIEQYIAKYPAASTQIAWWIMENRREYFDRAKLLLSRVKMLIFLSESQSKQWLTWCEEEGIKLFLPPALVPLSVNDELAFVAGIPCSLNTPSFSVETMLERRRLLRDAVREEMGLTDQDMLVMSLSSINPGKGQLMLLEATRLAVERNHSMEDPSSKIIEKTDPGVAVGQDQSALNGKKHPKALFGIVKRDSESGKASVIIKEPKKNLSRLRRKVLSDNLGTQERNLKVVIGSVGSKSNKVAYVKGLLRFLSLHSELSKVVLWTPATTHVASLYSAADVYIINSQGIGETFGRVTIEAMAYGLPVLGTEAGGTKEIVEHNVTGLLHPIGRPGAAVLAQDLLFLLENPTVREQMGMKGRKKVEKMYLKRHMYRKLGMALIKCMRIK